MAPLTPKERKTALNAIDRQRCRRRPILFRKADEYARLGHAQVFVMVRYQCHVISKTRTFIYHSDPESDFPRLPWQKLRVQEYPRPEVLTPASFRGRRRQNEAKARAVGRYRHEGGGCGDEDDEGQDEDEGENDDITEVVAPQFAGDQQATGVAGPALTRAAATRPFTSPSASRLATSPDPSRFVFSRPSSPRATLSHVDHAVRPITPPSVGPHAVASLTPGPGVHDLISWPSSPSPSPVGPPASTPDPIGPPSASGSPAPLPMSHDPVTPPFTRFVFSPVQMDSTGPAIFKHSAGPFNNSATPSPMPQIKTEQDEVWPARDSVQSEIHTPQPNTPRPTSNESSDEVIYRAREQSHGVGESVHFQQYRGVLRGRRRSRRLRQQGTK